ncbi:MAG: phosphatase family protein [Paenibacillus sp.]|nr:phosphatase family protein [Paenibacillus sp.]
MYMKFRHALVLVLSFLFATGFAFIAAIIHERQADPFDKTIMEVVYSYRSTGFTSFIKGIAFIGSEWMVGILVLVFSLFFFILLRYRRRLFFFIGVIAGSVLLNEGLKLLFHRKRPTLDRIMDAAGSSFPSGQSMIAVVLYGILIFLLWPHLTSALKRWTAILLGISIITAIGFSRIYLGVHYPTDVLGGYTAGGSWLCVAIWVFYRSGLPASK